MGSCERRLCIDIDNVIACTDAVMRDVIRQHTEGRVCLRYEDVTRFEYEWCCDAKGQGIDDNEWKIIHHDKFSVPEVIASIEPMPDAGNSLRKLSKAGFDIHFLTARKGHAETATEQWLARHFGELEYTLDIAPHRQKHKIEGPLFASVEDDLEQALLFLGLSRDTSVHDSWKWIEDGAAFVEHSFVFAHPWNCHVEWCPVDQRHDRLKQLHRLKDWAELTDKILEFA